MDDWSGSECWLWFGANLGKGLYCTVLQKTIAQYRSLRGLDDLPESGNFLSTVGRRNRKPSNTRSKAPSRSIGLKM